MLSSEHLPFLRSPSLVAHDIAQDKGNHFSHVSSVDISMKVCDGCLQVLFVIPHSFYCSLDSPDLRQWRKCGACAFVLSLNRLPSAAQRSQNCG